jgi:hypothetical protein
MERQRSPSYPSLSLPQAIDMVGKLHKSNRTSVISRETAAKDMGYAGLTGRSLTVIAALAQYGLIDRAGKGDIKVSRRAVDILHAVDETDRAEAIQEAAFSPKLFMQLHERFPEGVPSHNALRSYLIQQEFADVAIGPAITAFLETNLFAENAKESGSYSGGGHNAPESPEQTQETPMQAQPLYATTNTPSVQAYSSAMPSVLNQIDMDIRGDRVMISGLLDEKGLDLLEKNIAALKMLLSFQLEAKGNTDPDLATLLS